MANEKGGASEPREVRGFRITGRVQGVGFRWWTRDAASSLGLEGSVWNRSDGSVEVCAAGGRAALDALERVLGEGPPGARVGSVTPVTPDHEPGPGPFRIEHR